MLILKLCALNLFENKWKLSLSKDWLAPWQIHLGDNQRSHLAMQTTVGQTAGAVITGWSLSWIFYFSAILSDTAPDTSVYRSTPFLVLCQVGYLHTVPRAPSAIYFDTSSAESREISKIPESDCQRIPPLYHDASWLCCLSWWCD